ncbi:hypothetical protein BO79DRAFT_253434 [Aspergillus costaricaensis CBS 115574]|uniref:Uncharacterized protein n=1 Tax=Aspergillus costaricaensis CBS 115574 TaxID=1448317 RepID=A0ACD1IJA4_9EURO|nr:hypothetical protein BO79DRAFT_253434 [Aspergillus costaricaensis CBS 115574]RAK90648.1 hypothetical protein BO79DRAFT_253434 [Aspergillus costaricaensis CBS 115574]
MQDQKGQEEKHLWGLPATDVTIHSAFPRQYAGAVSFNLASVILAQWRRSSQAHREHYCTVHGTVKWAPDGPIIVRSHAKASKGLRCPSSQTAQFLL